jgi:uncharacterized protein YqfA (UPF0365 family)
MPLAAVQTLLYIALLIFLLPIGVAGALCLWNVRYWIHAARARLPVTVFEIAGMRLRGVDVWAVLDALEILEHAGIAVSQVDVQRADRRGVDVRQVASELVEAIAAGEHDATFDRLVDRHAGNP